MAALPRQSIPRIVLTGSESTGKSTLATALAHRYGAELVPEFVRAFAETKGGPIDFTDHGPIARGQMALEDEHLARATRLVIQDTDLLSTVVYCRHYFGRCPEWIEAEARLRRPDLYFVCELDVPWISDGIRDRGDRREEMQALFRVAVETSGAPVVTISGSHDDRVSVATAIIDRLLLNR